MIKGNIIEGVIGSHQPPNQRQDKSGSRGRVTVGKQFSNDLSHFCSPYDSFCSKLSFRECIENILGDRNSDFLQNKGQICLLINRIKMVCPWRADWTGLLADHLKDWAFLRSGFLSCNKFTVCAASTWAYLYTIPVELGGQRELINEADAARCDVTKSFISSLGVSCLLPASIKLWQANL